MNILLIDLEPRWWAYFTCKDHYHGLSFICPHCLSTRLAIEFANIDCPVKSAYPFKWTVQGEHWFETLTLTPSIDASKQGHWHGFIKDGEII